MILFHLYRTPALSTYQTANLLEAARGLASRAVRSIDSEFCYNVASRKKLTADQMRLLRWLLAETFEPENFSPTSFFTPLVPPLARGERGGSSRNPKSAIRNPPR
jgi:hypothetical protein